MKTKLLIIKFILGILFLFHFSNASSAEYIIYSVVQEIPMGEPGEIVKKNYYINIGQKQGVEAGTMLDVLRQISRQDPYETKKRFKYNVKIGKLKVIHSEDDSAIAILETINTGNESPLYEIDNFMVGDNVQVHLN